MRISRNLSGEGGLADELVLIVSPVLLGTGKRFFAEGTPARSFGFVSSQATPSGVILSTCQVAGPLKTGSPDKMDMSNTAAGVGLV